MSTAATFWYLTLDAEHLKRVFLEEYAPVKELALRYPGAHDQSLSAVVEKLFGKAHWEAMGSGEKIEK